MSRIRPLEIIRYFYASNLNYIPLIRDLEETLEGFLSRDLLNRELSDLGRAETEYEQIPDEWVVIPIAREELMKLAAQTPVPVLNFAGQQKTEWSDTELLHQAARLKERHAKQDIAEEPPTLDASPESSDQWFARLVLSAIPHPILATDLHGHALFYNEGFQARILGRDLFHGNLALAETYFLELTRGLLARIYSEGPHPADLLFASIPELSISVEITTIHRESRTSGYLYIFQDPELSGIPHEVLSRLERGMSLDEIMEELEAGIIASMLRRNGQNVSHAAQALRINRSTLQNKIKRLNVNERFGRKVDGPVRRVRTEAGNEDPSIASNASSTDAPSQKAATKAHMPGESKRDDKASKRNSSKTAAKKKTSANAKKGKVAGRKKSTKKSAATSADAKGSTKLKKKTASTERNGNTGSRKKGPSRNTRS
ncbi:MAG: hypothetical protein KDK37_02130 [Leptospiraceae bacterium]|nr:hypothetical protein [Leptospiraceae bacterium]